MLKKTFYTMSMDILYFIVSVHICIRKRDVPKTRRPTGKCLDDVKTATVVTEAMTHLNEYLRERNGS